MTLPPGPESLPVPSLCLIVLEDGRPTGIVSRADLLEALAR